MPTVDIAQYQDGDFLVDYEEKILLYGPGATWRPARLSHPGCRSLPGASGGQHQIRAFISEGGEVYVCRFALQALYGQTEQALLEGIRPINPLDVMDLRLLMRREGALIIDTWTV